MIGKMATCVSSNVFSIEFFAVIIAGLTTLASNSGAGFEGVCSVTALWKPDRGSTYGYFFALTIKFCLKVF